MMKTAQSAFLLLALASPVGAQEILLLDWASNNSFAQVAAANLGYTPTVVVDESSFNAMLPGTPWQAVIVDNPSNLLNDPGPLADYIDSGIGGVVLNYWNADDPEYADIVTTRMGAIGLVAFFVPQTLFCWDCSDGVWNEVNLLAEVLPGPVDLWSIDGDTCDTTGTGIALGGFLSATPAAGQVGLIRSAPVSETWLVTIVLDGSDAVQATQMWANLIEIALDADPPLCFPVRGLSAIDLDCTTDTIDLSWTVTDPAAIAIEVSRDGAVVASLGASDTSFTDVGVSDGPRSYSVVSMCPLGPSAPRTMSVDSTSTGAVDHIVFRLDGGAGQIDSATAIETALSNAGESWIEETSLTGLFCSDSETVFWVVTGTFPDDLALDAPSGTALRDHADAGGRIYFEGANTWAFDAPTEFSFVDGVEDGTALSAGGLVLLSGLDSGVGADASGFFDVGYNQDQAGGDFNDLIFAATLDDLGPNAGVLWQIPGGLGNTGIAYQGNNGARLICQSWEFGGFDGDQAELLSRYVSFLSGGGTAAARFIRGDLNSDAGVDISDAIFGLSAYLIPGSPIPACADSSDVNGDGNFDIADIVYLLSWIFVPGAPQPAFPYPDCAPTPSTLGCGTPQC